MYRYVLLTPLLPLVRRYHATVGGDCHVWGWGVEWSEGEFASASLCISERAPSKSLERDNKDDFEDDADPTPPSRDGCVRVIFGENVDREALVRNIVERAGARRSRREGACRHHSRTLIAWLRGTDDRRDTRRRQRRSGSSMNNTIGRCGRSRTRWMLLLWAAI